MKKRFVRSLPLFHPHRVVRIAEAGSGGQEPKKGWNKMKTTRKTAIVLLALGASAWMATAQDGSAPPPRGERPQREGPAGPGGPGQPGERGQTGGPARDGQRPPPPPLMAALDANHDGVIDEEE